MGTVLTLRIQSPSVYDIGIGQSRLVRLAPGSPARMDLQVKRCSAVHSVSGSHCCDAPVGFDYVVATLWSHAASTISTKLSMVAKMALNSPQMQPPMIQRLQDAHEALTPEASAEACQHKRCTAVALGMPHSLHRATLNRSMNAKKMPHRNPCSTSGHVEFPTPEITRLMLLNGVMNLCREAKCTRLCPTCCRHSLAMIPRLRGSA